MKKDAYYFPHFCNARNDRKIKRLLKDLGIEGYGIFFLILEILREQTDFKFPLKDVDLLADEFKTSEAKVKTIISNYDLFSIDKENNFFSPKLVFYLQPYIEKSERARSAALIRWNKVNLECKSNANALQIESKCNANQNAKRGEERKVKETKENNNTSSSSSYHKNDVDDKDFSIIFLETAEFWNQWCKNTTFNKVKEIKNTITIVNAYAQIFIEALSCNFDIKKICSKIQNNKFLSDFYASGKADFFWLLKKKDDVFNFAKILGGHYDNK